MAMYERHFGLTKRPFPASARGHEVFVGPQIITAMAGLKRSLAAPDAIAAVSGPVGSGKTTLVLKSLQAIGTQPKIVHLGRMHLQSNDVIDHLLDELGVDTEPTGPIQKFSAFQRCLQALNDDNSRLIVAVEDCARLGVDTLAELEALTAADTGPSNGASVVLMGDEKLVDLLNRPELARTKQRTRQHYTTAPLTAAEVRGYLRHCFRLAGGDFETLFEANAAPFLCHLSGGIPRVVNSLVEAALSAAADQQLDSVPAELIAQVANDEFGISGSGFDFDDKPTHVIVTTAADAPVPDLQAMPIDAPTQAADEQSNVVHADDQAVEKEGFDPDDLLDAESDQVEESGADDSPGAERDITLPKVTILQPQTTEQESAAPKTSETVHKDLPDLDVLAPQLTTFNTAVDGENHVEAEVEVEEEVEVETDSSDENAMWNRDPTVEELRPDMAALEEAMASANAVSDELTSEPTIEPTTDSMTEAEIPELMPEITLDVAIGQQIENTNIDRANSVDGNSAASKQSRHESSDPDASSEISLPSRKFNKADAEIDNIASELAKAKSLDDVDDKMAETLFGDDLSFAASQFIIAPSPTETKPAESRPVETKPVETEPVETKPVETDPVETSSAINDGDHPPQSDLKALSITNDAEVALEMNSDTNETGIDLGASQRFQTVRALNADSHPSLREPKINLDNNDDQISEEAAESIEDQVDVSMTPTFEALNLRRPTTQSDDVADHHEGKPGFFSRFKRS